MGWLRIKREGAGKIGHGNQGRSFYIRRYAAAYHLRFYIFKKKIKISYLGLFISI